MSTTAEIRATLLVKYPQIGVITANNTALIDAFIDDAKLYHNETVWANKYDLGVTYLACHFITESQPKASNSGVVIMEKTDSSETQFLHPSVSKYGEFGTTKYGRAWEALRSTILAGALSFYVI